MKREAKRRIALNRMRRARRPVIVKNVDHASEHLLVKQRGHRAWWVSLEWLESANLRVRAFVDYSVWTAYRGTVTA